MRFAGLFCGTCVGNGHKLYHFLTKSVRMVNHYRGGLCRMDERSFDNGQIKKAAKMATFLMSVAKGYFGMGPIIMII